jgi:hypothetical protein
VPYKKAAADCGLNSIKEDIFDALINTKAADSDADGGLKCYIIKSYPIRICHILSISEVYKMIIHTIKEIAYKLLLGKKYGRDQNNIDNSNISSRINT